MFEKRQDSTGVFPIFRGVTVIFSWKASKIGHAVLQILSFTMSQNFSTGLSSGL